jgi:hypothetical protein
MASLAVPLGHSAPVSPGRLAPVVSQRRAGKVLPARGPNGRFVRAPSREPLTLVAPAAVASEDTKERRSPPAGKLNLPLVLRGVSRLTNLIDRQDDAACSPAKRQRTPVKQGSIPMTIKVEDEVVLLSIEVWPESLAPSPPPNTKAIIVFGKRRKVVREVYLSSRAGCPQRPRPNLKLRVTQRGQTRLVRDIFLPPRVPKDSPKP